jgi:hypothetical protein
VTRIKLRGFQIFKDRHGKWRAYHRKTRTPVDLDKTPIGSAEFFAECAKIAALAEGKAQKEKPGTLGRCFATIESHRRSKTSRRGPAPTTKAISIIFARSRIRLCSASTDRLLCEFATRRQRAKAGASETI